MRIKIFLHLLSCRTPLEGSKSEGRSVDLELGEAMVVQNQAGSKEAFEQKVAVVLCLALCSSSSSRE